MENTIENTNSYLPDFHRISRVLIWIIVVIAIIGSIFLVWINGNAFLDYRPERIVQRFVSLIENPTQTVTDNEKSELSDIMQSNFFSSWGNENNIKTLRRVSQSNPISYSDIEFTGESRRTAQSTLTFENDFINENSKTAVIYLERYGNWYQSGIKWQIFKIDMPQEDNILDEAAEITNSLTEDIQEGTQNVIDRVRGLFGDEE